MGSFYMEATQINYRRDETFKTVDQKLQELSETSAIDTDIAPVFKSTNTYHPGDMVYYRNKLYVFNVEHTGAWAAADVTATDVTTEISSLKSGLTNKTKDTSFNVTCGECFSVERQGSHYITDKVVHINCIVKALSVPDETDVSIAILPSGMTAIKQEGMTFPIFKADGRWGRFDSIMYGYVSTYALTTKKSEVVADHYYYVDFIAHIT